MGQLDGEDFVRLFKDALESSSVKVYNSQTKDYEQAVNSMFERLSTEHGYSLENPYDNGNFKRVGFESEEQSADFANLAKKQGIDVIVAPIKLHGQWLVEIPKESIVSDGSTCAAEQVIATYAQKTGTVAQSVNQYTENNQVEKSPINPDTIESSFLGYFDKLGNFVSNIHRAEYLLGVNSFADEQIYADGLFRTALDYNDNARSYALKTETTRSEKAIVINGDTPQSKNIVIVKGKIIDGKVKEHALNQHAKRMKRADDNIAWAKKRDDAKKNISSITGIKLGDDSKKQLTIRKNSELIKKMVFNEYISNQVVSQASKTGGVLDTIVSDFNTNAIIAALDTTNISLSSEELSAIRKSLMSANFEQKRLLSNITIGACWVHTFKERETIIEVLSNALKSGVHFSEEEKYAINNMLAEESRIRLTDKEKGFFSSAKKTAESLNSDLGLDFSKNGIERKDILEINEKLIERAEKANIQLVKYEGMLKKAVFDNDNFTRLTTAQLKKLGISTETKELIAELNAPSAWGGKNYNKPQSNLLYMAMSGFMKVTADNELNETITEMRKITKPAEYVKSAVTSVRNYSKSLRAIIESDKANNISGTGITNKNINKKKPKDKIGTVQKSNTIDKKANKKFLERDKKKLKKLEKSEKSIFAKFRNFKASIGKKIAKNKLVVIYKKISGKIKFLLAKYIGMGLAFFLLTEGLLLILVVTFMSIQSLLAGANQMIDGLLAPQSYKDTVCYKVYQHLAEQEQQWLSSLQNTSDIYDMRYKLTYGINAESFNDYINRLDNIVTDDLAHVYINPFWQAGENVVSSSFNSSAMTSVSKYDGQITSELCTNLNAYGNKDLNEDGTYIGTENGHTSNTRDIISMLDVMFQFQMDDYDDGEMASILTLSEGEVKWRDGTNKASAWFSTAINNLGVSLYNIGSFVGTLNLGTIIGNIFDSESAEIEYKKLKDWTFEVKDKTVSYNALLDYVDTLFMYSHSQYLMLDVEYYPVKNLEINVAGNPTELICNQEEASKLGLCVSPVKKDFKILSHEEKIIPYIETKNGSYYDLSSGIFDVTLSMDNGTYVDDDQCIWAGMDSNNETFEIIKSNNCWIETKAEPIDFTCSGSGSDTDLGYAESIAYNECLADYNTVLSGIGTETFYLSDNKNYFEHNWYNISSFDVSYDTNEYTVTEEYIPQITITNDDGSITISNGEPEYEDVTYYDVSATATVYTSHHDIYDRKCLGHTFCYCGGHVCVNSQGNVWSVTNEQQALVNCFDNENICPIVEGLDLKELGYYQLLGKVDNKDNRVDNSCALKASTTGGSKSPLFDIQGSDSSIRGLNLYINASGELEEGMNYNGTNIHYFRDIFDCDCSIDKGWSVFPFDKLNFFSEYKGWDSNNITLVCGRISQSWEDIYNFSIPYEVSGKAEIGDTTLLAEKDIKAISDALATVYGADYTEERKEATELALRWVNRGHYNENHSDHAFLSSLCTAKETEVTNGYGETSSVQYSANCTAGNGEDFAKFILFRSGKIDNIADSIESSITLGSINDCLPADILIHKASSDLRECELTETPNPSNLSNIVTTLLDYQKTKYVIYVGTLTSDLVLTNGQTIRSGVPITVDLSKNIDAAGGTVYLRCETSTSWSDISNDKNYYWVIKPDGKTKIYRFN